MDSKTEVHSIRLRIRRCAGRDCNPFWQEIDYRFTDAGTTVANALADINGKVGTPLAYRDSEGNSVQTIRWECSCLQKKCGACAMVIDGRPSLACDSVLLDSGESGMVTVEPLRKFPLVADLVVDRSCMFENLKKFGMWADEDFKTSDSTFADSYDSSRCIQCGCCLEVCPNFSPGNDFYGAAVFVPAARFLENAEKSDRKRLSGEYSRHVFEGCGKSLACKDICPRNIDTENLLVRSNAVAVWKRRIQGVI